MILYGGVVAFALVIVSRGTQGAVSFLPAFAVLILSATAISSALQVVDKKTIATFRRVQTVLLAGDLLWLLIATVGVAYALPSGSQYPLTTAVLFGAFVCAGFEFVVIQGAFEKNASMAFGLAVLHPAATLVIIRLPELASRFDVLGASSGAVALAILVAFPLLLRQRKTSLGHDALSLFQAFMKTWVAGNPDELEKIIADHSEEVEVATRVLRFRTKMGDTFMVLPGVHPGPFHPVGSYDLPRVISDSFKELGPVLTLHRPGGHERNLATRAETLSYARSVSELAQSVTLDYGRALLRGPECTKVGKATATALAFDTDLIMTVSFAPLGSDDIDTGVEAVLVGPASEVGLDLSVIDAHNSINPKLESPMTDDPGWKRLFEAVRGAKPDKFAIAYSHSSEVGFSGRGDLTENGIALLMVQKQGTKWVLVLADANNSVSDLRAAVEKALAASGYGLIEFCTSDSHNLAARGLTVERGYEALGEATPLPSITELVVKLAKLSESKLAPAQYGSAKMKSRVNVFGSRALEEFAAITQSSSKFARNYLGLAAAAVAVLLLVSLLF